MIVALSLLPLAATLLGLTLAFAATVSNRRPLDHRTAFFALLNAFTALWALSEFGRINWYPDRMMELAPLGSFGYALATVAALGMAGAPTYWFLFAAENARLERFTRGRGLLAVHSYAAYTLVVSASNPLHRQFVRVSETTGEALLGPLVYPHYVGAWLLVTGGLVLLVREAWSRHTSEGRRDAALILLASTGPFVGGLASNVLWAAGLPHDLQVAPLLFAPLNAVLGWLVFRTGYADIVPVATAEAFDSIRDAAIAIDTRDVIVALNESACHAFPTLVTRHRLAEVAKDLAASVDEARRAQREVFEFREADRLWWCGLHPMKPKTGGTLGTLVILTDITEKLEREHELHQARIMLEERVRERTGELESANRDLEEATRAKDVFLANVSHELRTPLSAIIAFAQDLLQVSRDPLTVDQRRKVEVILESGKHQQAIIDDLLALSRLKLGRTEVFPKQFSLLGFVDLVASMVRAFAEQGGLEFRLHAPAEDLLLVTDQDKVRQILLNLLTNAVKFTAEGSVTLEVETDTRDRVLFRVRDTGRGIDPADLPTIMDEFVQVDRADGMKPDGTGLGLAISRRLAALLGGRLSVESEPGRGSTFSLELPRAYGPGIL